MFKYVQMAAKCITNFGPQAELVFIEGLTRDRNQKIRCECAKGLAVLGPQTFKALLLGLKYYFYDRDKDDEVRIATSNALVSNLTAAQIID